MNVICYFFCIFITNINHCVKVKARCCIMMMMQIVMSWVFENRVSGFVNSVVFASLFWFFGLCFFLDGDSVILLVKKFSLLKAQNNKGYKSLKNMFLNKRKIKRTILNKYGKNCRQNITKSLLNFQKRPVFFSDWFLMPGYTTHHFIADDVPRQKAGRQGLHLCICSVIIHNSSVFLHSRCRLSILCIYIDTQL